MTPTKAEASWRSSRTRTTRRSSRDTARTTTLPRSRRQARGLGRGAARVTRDDPRSEGRFRGEAISSDLEFDAAVPVPFTRSSLSHRTPKTSHPRATTSRRDPRARPPHATVPGVVREDGDPSPSRPRRTAPPAARRKPPPPLPPPPTTRRSACRSTPNPPTPPRTRRSRSPPRRTSPSDALLHLPRPAARIGAGVLVPAVTSNDVLATSDVDATREHMFQPTPKSPCPQTKCANVVPERMIPDDAAMTAPGGEASSRDPNRAARVRGEK